MPKKKPVEGKPVVHPELDGFEVSINEFGEIVSNTKIDVLNNFLDKHVDDKKFKNPDGTPIKNAKKKDIEDDEFDDEDDFEDDDDMNDDDDLPEEDDEEIDEDENDPYDLDDKDPDFEDIEELVKSMEKDFGKRGRLDDDEQEEETETVEEEYLDEYNDDYSEEDSYNFDDGDQDDRY